MNKISIHIVYQSEIGRPLTAARIPDTDLVVQVANRAIERAKREASAVTSIDAFVGQVKMEEAQKLEDVLRTLIPEMVENPH